MTDEAQRQKSRFCELSRKAGERGIFLFSPFLGLAEQSLLEETIRKGDVFPPPVLFGGAQETERVMARFGDVQENGYEMPFPIVCLHILPDAPKFAEVLTHRDILGALLHLGITREVLGDIICRDNESFFFAQETMAQHICTQLRRIRHTDVHIQPIDTLPPGTLYRVERIHIQVQSERLDAVIAKVFSLSREKSQELFAAGRVFAQGVLCSSPSGQPRVGQIISVRGEGRFRYLGAQRLTKKGKTDVVVERFV